MTVESKDEYGHGLVRFCALDAYANMPALITIEASRTKASQYLQTWTPLQT